MKLRLLYACLAIFFILFNARLLAQSQNIEFRHMSKATGLDQPFPYHMIQDQNGYIWIAGENGLWRYSGSQFKHYYHNANDSNSLSYDFVWRILEDKKGNIWAGTYGGGLSKYNPSKNTFTNYTFDENDPESISNNKIRGLEEDGDGNIWVGTNKGLDRLNIETGKFKRFSLADGLSSMIIRDLELSKDQKQLYIATGGGLNILDLKTKEIKVIDESLEPGYRLNYNYVYDMHEIEGNQLLIATGNGLHLLDLSSFQVVAIPSNHQDGKGPSSSVTFAISDDPDNPNKLWLATMDGINTYDINKKKFRKINAFQKDGNKISGSNIYNVLKDRNGGLWAAVNNAGVYYSHPSFNKFKTEVFLTAETDKYLNRYTSYIRHSEEELLITTYSGLVVWNQQTNNKQVYKIPGVDNRLSQITHLEGDKYLISVWSKFIYLWDHGQKKLSPIEEDSEFGMISFNLRILKDSKDRVWLGNSERGLFLYDPKTNKASPFQVSDLNELENSGDEYVKYLFEDSKKRVWVGTADGLHQLDEKTNSFKKFSPKDGKNSLSNGNINHISESKKGGLWISTELGLCYLDVENGQFKRYYKEDGLPSNVISSALEDQYGNLWVATASGLSRLQENGNFSNYDQSDGLMEEYFIFGSAYKDEKLGLIFGTSTEIVIVQSNQIIFNAKAPEIRLEKLSINNEIVNPQNRPDVLKQSFSRTDQITITQSDYLVNITFDALNLVNGHKNEFSVFLEGLDEDWRAPSKDRSISFSKLPPGKYTLYIKASNDEKVWSKEQAGLIINVLPFWYESELFRALLSFSIILLVGLIIYGRFNTIKNVNKKLEKTVGERTQEVLAQKEEIESQNEKLVSRNERIELLLRELNHRIKNNLQLISSILNLHSRSTKNMATKMALTEGKLRMQALSILHQKLYMTESYTEVNCKEYIEELLDYLSIAFKSHYAQVAFKLDLDEFKLNLDQAMPLGLIINELITNSLKHSGQKNLLIELSAKVRKNEIVLKVKDNGAGISNEQYHASDSFGFSLIKSLTDQINGDLKVGCEDGAHFLLTFTNTLK